MVPLFRHDGGGVRRRATWFVAISLAAGSLVLAQGGFAQADATPQDPVDENASEQGKAASEAKSDNASEQGKTHNAKGGNAAEPDPNGPPADGGGGAARNGAGGGAKQDDVTHPPGNNGTVKIDGVPFDDHPDNEPHVGCAFQVDFYNYDEGDDLLATYTFELIPPTAGGVLMTDEVFIGEDPNGGGTDLDASVTVDLSDELAASGVEPHEQRGFHIKLTVHADGSIGADVKHKVFWVLCPLGAGAAVPPPVVGGVVQERPPEVLGEQILRPEVLGLQLARTGAGFWPVLLLAFVLIGSGTILVRASRRLA